MVGEVESYGIHGRDTEQNPVSEIKEGLENSLEVQGFPCGSAGKESTCNVGDLGSIPGLGRYPLEKETATHSSILAGEFHGQRRLVSYSPWGHKDFYSLNKFLLSDFIKGLRTFLDLLP